MLINKSNNFIWELVHLPLLWKYSVYDLTIPSLFQINSSRKTLVVQHLKTKQHIAYKGKFLQLETEMAAANSVGPYLDGSSQEGTNQEGASQEGASQEGTNQEGTSQQGSSQGGCTQEGCSTAGSSQSVAKTRQQFHADLCSFFMKCDIPLNNVNKEACKEFMKKYTGRSVPDQSTLRKYYVSEIYNKTMKELRRKAFGQKLWVSLDETTDVDQRYIACFIFGVLGVEEEREKCYLANVAVLPKVNHYTISAFFNNSLLAIWPTEIKYENVLLVCTDAAAYMIKSMAGLQVLYPKMIHVTCLAHGLHRIADMVRSNNPEVNRLIYTCKSVFIKAPRRTEIFKEMLPDVPLPPAPVLTRWGTWLNAVGYYVKHFEDVASVVMSLNAEESCTIKECQELLNRYDLKISLASINSSFSIISSTIEKLETRGLPIASIFTHMNNVEEALQSSYNDIYLQKFKSVLQKNKGYAIIQSVHSALTGNPDTNNSDMVSNLTPSELQCLKYAPLVSCDAERVFSQYKVILSDNRRRFNFENLKCMLVVKCN